VIAAICLSVPCPTTPGILCTRMEASFTDRHKITFRKVHCHMTRMIPGCKHMPYGDELTKLPLKPNSSWFGAGSELKFGLSSSLLAAN